MIQSNIPPDDTPLDLGDVEAGAAPGSRVVPEGAHPWAPSVLAEYGAPRWDSDDWGHTPEQIAAIRDYAEWTELQAMARQAYLGISRLREQAASRCKELGIGP